MYNFERRSRKGEPMASTHCWIANVPGHSLSDLSCDLSPGRLTSVPIVTGHLVQDLNEAIH